jgi:hypothetical protein
MKKSHMASQIHRLEALEDRRLMTTTWGYWPTLLEQDKLVQNYPWLTGSGFGVAVIDQGIDYWHPALGGDRATSTKSPRIVNVHDYRDGDDDPFPSESELTDASSAHGTGVAGVLAAFPYDAGGHHYQGVLQGSLLYNLRTDRFNSESTIKQALDWVVANHAKYNITVVNMTDFVGTSASTPIYASEVQALWNAGVFIATPVANDWNNPASPKQPISLPATSPYIFGTGGDGTTVNPNGPNKHVDPTVLNPKTERGSGLDIISQSTSVTLPYYTPSKDQDVYVVDAGEGNSWGTPTITGMAVLLQQIDPTITPQEIMQILQDSGVPVVDTDGTGTYARLDMYAAVNLAYSRRDDVFDQGAGGDDDMAHAAAITLNGQNQGSLSNLKLLIHDNDYYTFNVSAPSDFNFAVNYSGSSPFPNAELMDSAGNIIGNIGSDGISGKHLPAGQYYIHLFNAIQSLNGTYGVDINAAPVVVTTAGQNGTFNSIAYDASDNLDMVWYDGSSKTLKYAQRNTSKVWSNTQIIDNVGDVGSFVSMSLDSTGKPGVAYYDSTNADLKYAHYNGSQWNVETVDSHFTTGYYPSLKFDGSDHPVIAYYYKTSGDLRMATNNGSAWTISTIDSKSDVGRYPSLALNPATGRYAIAYEATAAGAFKFAQDSKKGWSTTVVDVNGSGGGFISLAFDNLSEPGFSYYDATNADLKFARLNGTVWSKTTVASKRSQGLYTNLFFDLGDNGNPVIYYFNKTNDELMDARSDGSVWNFEALATGGGRENHVALNSQDFETFDWVDDASGDLKVADS